MGYRELMSTPCIAGRDLSLFLVALCMAWRPMVWWTLLVWALVGVMLGPLSPAAFGHVVFRDDRLVVGNEDLLAWVLTNRRLRLRRRGRRSGHHGSGRALCRAVPHSDGRPERASRVGAPDAFRTPARRAGPLPAVYGSCRSCDTSIVWFALWLMPFTSYWQRQSPKASYVRSPPCFRSF